MEREILLSRLREICDNGGHVVGAVAGSGMTARNAIMGGADMLLALNAGKYRLMGQGSFASYFCYGNGNDVTMELGMRELLPLLKDTPIIFGLFASDPTILIYEYLKKIKNAGFSGIVNFPTIALIDGKFRKAIEAEGNTFAKEVEAISLAKCLDLFTIAFVTNEEETRAMLQAGADVICVHFGATKGGYTGTGKFISLDEARIKASRLLGICENMQPNVFRMFYAGPVNSPVDARYLYDNTPCQGYIGGSTFDRIPSEQATIKAVSEFRKIDNADREESLHHGNIRVGDYISFIKEYVEEHFDGVIRLNDLALYLNISPSYLSTKFREETGVTFTEYLIRYRMNKAVTILKTGEMSCKEAAAYAGYKDYSQFSKTFSKYIGQNPSNISRNKY